MAKETGPSLEQGELQVKKTTHNRKRYELGLIENLLNRYLAGFRAFKEFKIGEISQLEIVWLVFIVRIFNSLRCAYSLLQKGYYNQAIMLVRSAEEDYLTCRDCEKNEKTIKALLDGKGQLGKGEFTFSSNQNPAKLVHHLSDIISHGRSARKYPISLPIPSDPWS